MSLRPLTLRVACLILACLILACLILSPALASAGIITQHVDSNNPTTETFTGSGSISLYSGPVNDNGVPAWQIDTVNEVASANGWYEHTFTAGELSRMNGSPLDLTVSFRIVEDMTPGSDIGILFDLLINKNFQVALGVDGDDLLVRQLGGVEHQIIGAAAGYHTFKLSDPDADRTFDVYLDGQFLDSWAGAGGGGSRLRFGDFSGNAGENAIVNWSLVQLAIPEPSTALLTLSGLALIRRRR